jgi:ADP-ribose pyrophosphatase YjhB (NUDIX family)
VSAELLRHVNALVADFAADYGEVDLVGRRVDCGPDEYEAILENFERFDVVGGAGLRVRDDRGRVLLVRYRGADGWVDPGDGRRPGESFRECARRGIDEAAGIDASVVGLAQIHLLYVDDWTDRDPIPNPYVAFEGRLQDGEATPDDVHPGDDVADLRWADEPPGDLLYDELAELSLGE